MLGRTKPLDENRSLPKGEAVGTYGSYLDAQKAVDYLADQQFPVQTVSILGNELKTVERVTGRLSYPRVALAGAATGAWFGLFVGVVLTLFGSSDAYFLILSSMALGAGFWMLFGVITYALQRGKRDFTSTSQVVATSYDVIVAADAAQEARRLLQQLPMNGQAGHPAQPPAAGQGGQGYGGPGQGGVQGQTQGGSAGYGQPGAQDQPGQSPQRPASHGQAPQRPAGWDDPYGASPQGQPGQPGQQVAGEQQPPAVGASQQPDAVGNQTAGQPAQEPQAVPRGHFPDLPDGRPQYGERVPAAGPQQPAQQYPEPQQAPQRPAQEPGTGEGPGTAEDPQPGQNARPERDENSDGAPYDQDQNNRR